MRIPRSGTPSPRSSLDRPEGGMASSEPIVLPPVAGCDNNGGAGAEGDVDVEFIDFDDCSLEDRTNLCRILRVGGAPPEEPVRYLDCFCDKLISG